MSKANVVPLFGSDYDAYDRSNAVDVIDAGLAALYPVELYPDDQAHQDSEIADEISAAAYTFFGMPANEIDMEPLKIFETERARDMLRYIASRALGEHPPETIAQIARLQRLVDAETDPIYARPDFIAPVISLRTAQ